MLTELSGREREPEPVVRADPVAPKVRVVGAIMVPHWREGLSSDVLPDLYRDIMEVVADASSPMQAKQIVPRIGLPAVTGKIERTRGKLKRLVQRGWLVEDQRGRFAPARRDR
ncbi:hypothetical protein [Streptomyces sp. NPDC006285]|uniref:hypothetical protein n=1 Tax=Streptomyces sp. NPDC006285 TaxID=3364742 RepID=UPI00368372BF